MSESSSGSGAVKVILAVGFVVAMLMVIGFGGVFLVMKYNHDQAREAAERDRLLREQETSRETLGAVGSALGATLGNRLSKNIKDNDDAQTLKEAAETLGGVIGKEIGRSGRSEELKDHLEAAGKALNARLQKSTEASDEPTEEAVGSGADQSL
jgi:hypothetical protein